MVGAGTTGEPITRRYEQESAHRQGCQGRVSGRRLRRHDTWIAATAMRHGAAVVTHDNGQKAAALRGEYYELAA